MRHALMLASLLAGCETDYNGLPCSPGDAGGMHEDPCDEGEILFCVSPDDCFDTMVFFVPVCTDGALGCQNNQTFMLEPEHRIICADEDALPPLCPGSLGAPLAVPSLRADDATPAEGHRM